MRLALAYLYLVPAEKIAQDESITNRKINQEPKQIPIPLIRRTPFGVILTHFEQQDQCRPCSNCTAPLQEVSKSAYRGAGSQHLIQRVYICTN